MEFGNGSVQSISRNAVSKTYSDLGQKANGKAAALTNCSRFRDGSPGPTGKRVDSKQQRER